MMLNDQITKNLGLDVIKYRWIKLRTAFNDNALLKCCLRFVLHLLAFLIVLPFAALFALLAPWTLKIRKDMKKAFDDLKSSSVVNRKIDFIDFLVACLMVVLNFIFLILLYVLSVPFLIIYWTYQFLEKLCSYTLIQWLISLLLLSGVIYVLITVITIGIGRPNPS